MVINKPLIIKKGIQLLLVSIENGYLFDMILFSQYHRKFNKSIISKTYIMTSKK